MPSIDQLSQAGSIADADEMAVFSKANGDTRKVTLPQVAAYVLGAIEGTPDDTLYSVDSGLIALLPATPGGWFWAQITLSAPISTLTLVMPGIDDRANGQEVLVTCTQAVTLLTISSNGTSLSGAPTSIGPATPFRMKYDSINNTWYRI